MVGRRPAQPAAALSLSDRMETRQARTPPPPAFELDGAEAGSRIEIFYAREQKWYGATVLGKRKLTAAEPAQLQYIYDGVSKKAKGGWICVSDPNTRFETTAANRWQRHAASYAHTTGRARRCSRGKRVWNMAVRPRFEPWAC